MTQVVHAKNGPSDSFVVRGARVLDPARGVDALLDVRVDDGEDQEPAELVGFGDRQGFAGGHRFNPSLIVPRKRFALKIGSPVCHLGDNSAV